MAEKNDKLEQLRKERDDAQLELDQARHRMNRTENQIERLDKTARKARTHLLCFKAAHIEYIFPVIKDASKTDFIQFCDGLIKVPGVKEYSKRFKAKPIGEVIK